MQRGWNNWFHINFFTYGQWLPGSTRGWRTRHHRDHVEGDYKHRVPSRRSDGLYASSRLSMPHPPVILLQPERRTIGFLLLESLAIQDVEVLSLCVGISHVHFLARCPANNPRTVAGRAKQHATKHFRRWVRFAHGIAAPVENPATAPESPWRGEMGRRLWERRGKERPIRNRGHQVHVYGYVLEHIDEDAWAWDFRHGEAARWL